jgi:hypothetical protein
VTRATFNVLCITVLVLLSATTAFSQIPSSTSASSTADAGAAAGGCGVVFLFGGFCALWAQNTGRRAWLWFFLGLFLNVIAVVLVLLLNKPARLPVQTATEPIHKLGDQP